VWLDIEADGQKIILTVVDTPGFGDNINNSKGFVKILDYVETQHKRFLAEESRVQRNAKFQDTRIHVLLYFIPATGHSLRDVDIVFMKQLGKRVNVIPVISKADSLLPSEIKEFKKRINEDIQKFDIPIFDFPVNSEDDEEIVQENKEFRSHLPFTVIGSGQKFDVGGRMVPARKYPWGTASVEDEKHSDYATLKLVLLTSVYYSYSYSYFFIFLNFFYYYKNFPLLLTQIPPRGPQGGDKRCALRELPPGVPI